VGVQEGQQRADHVALVVASGTIQMESGGPWSSDGIAFRPLAKTLRRIANDDSVKAVVLRLSSPGGSALASDLLWHELMDLRAKKPLIASVGDMAASGGYYMASATQQIFAEKSSIVGSIGVVGGKIVIADALSGIGINTATFAANPTPGSAERATYMSMLTPWDPPTIQKVQNQMNSVYQLFLQRVSQGRGLPIEAVAQVAEGRIWSGEQGLQRKLVDTFGGLDDALSRARELGKLNAEAPVIVEGAGETLLDLLSLDDHAEEEQVRAALAKLRAQPSALDVLTPQFRPFVAMLQPMLEGERVLAIIPHGVILQ
jgi:protease-4